MSFAAADDDDNDSSLIRKKFPRIPHIVNGPLKGGGVTRDDIVLTGSDAANFLQLATGDSVAIQEKVDGANLGISFHADSGGWTFQNRSHLVTSNSASQWRGLDLFIAEHGQSLLALFDFLDNDQQLHSLLNIQQQQQQKPQKTGNWTIYGEWLHARHSVPYEELPSPFLAFDLFHAPSDTWLSTVLMSRLLDKFAPSIHTVPVLGRFSQQQQPKWDDVHSCYYQKPSKFNPATCCEGGMIRVENGGKLVRRCKAVHDSFRCAIDEHWTSKELVKNKIVAQYEEFSAAAADGGGDDNDDDDA